MTTENNNTNNTQLLLPSQTSDKKTLVLDLDETLVHSQFMTFSTPSDVVIQIEIENEMHDINVMVRPGVKEFLENMEKYYEIVIFTASVSKYADPLLDIIDKKGYCPYRLFREHCSLINTTFVKDLQRLGRDLKDIVIVDNSPLSYSLHPKNGLPILTWFDDKSDRELFEIMPILEFLSNVPDVREFIPKFVGFNNKINYEQANEFIRNYTGQKNTFPEKKDEETKSNNPINQNNDTEINPNSNNQNIIQNKNNNNDNKENIELNKNKNNYINTNKESIGTNKNKLVDLAMKNIIASVSPDSVPRVNNDINKNQNLKNKGDSKSKINANNQKNKNNEDKKTNKDKNNIKIELVNNSINVKKLTNKNNTAHSTKKFKSAITETNFKTKQKRKNYSSGGNYIKSASAHINSDSKSIILKTDNKLNGLIKSKNATPKINKSINLINKNSHTTRSVKYTKKNDNYILISNSNNNNNNNNNNINVNNKMSKSLTKSTFNKKDNIIQNKNTKNSYKSYNSTSICNGLSNHKNQKSSNDFRSSQENIKIKQKNSAEKPKMTNKKVEKKELTKNKNNFLKTGFIQNKLMNNKMNNINMNLSNNLSLSNKFNSNNLNINGFDYTKTNRGTNQIKFTLTNSNILKSSYNKNYSPNNRYNKKSLDKNMFNNNINNNQSQLLKKKNSHKNNSVANDKISNINKNKEINNVNGLNRIKTARPKSSCTDNFDNKVNNSKNKNIFDNKKNKLKYQNKMKSEINEILQKRGISGKINDLKKEYKKI